MDRDYINFIRTLRNDVRRHPHLDSGYSSPILDNINMFNQNDRLLQLNQIITNMLIFNTLYGEHPLIPQRRKTLPRRKIKSNRSNKRKSN